MTANSHRPSWFGTKLSKAQLVSLGSEKLALFFQGAATMSINRVKFQSGMWVHDFADRFGSEAQCCRALELLPWLNGFHCPRRDGQEHYRIGQGGRVLVQCRTCRHQTSLTAGTMMDRSKLPMHKWFLATYLLRQAKTGLSSLALMRPLGVSYRTAWTVNQKIMLTKAQCNDTAPFSGDV
ncbi:transposase [Ideonella sp.]|uniref:transposase n=1 Tax=Ideonella sp. TaxID=1929293 RepID=UPI0037BEBCBE